MCHQSTHCSSVISSDTRRNKCIISTTIFSSYGNNCIQEPIIVFDRKPFVIMFCKNVIIQVQCLRHSEKISFKRSNIVYQNKMAKTKFYKNVSHKIARKSSGGFIWDRENYHKLSHVTYCVHQVYIIVIISMMTWLLFIFINIAKGELAGQENTY